MPVQMIGQPMTTVASIESKNELTYDHKHKLVLFESVTDVLK